MLRRPQKGYQWVGIIVTVLGVLPIAGESLGRASSKSSCHGSPSTDKVLISLALILLAELCRAIRFVFEERLLKHERLTPSFMVLMESCFGLVFASASWLVADVLGWELIDQTLSMLRNSATLQGLVITAVLAAGICNIAGAFITKYLSSVHNALVSELRVVFVWIPNVIYYFCDKAEAEEENRAPHGEPLDGWSALKIVGFAILISGAYVYNGSIRLPCSRLYPEQPAPLSAENIIKPHAVI
jgi:hypothetical protein